MADLASLIQSHITRSATARQRISHMNHIARIAAVTGNWSQLEAEIDGRIRKLSDEASNSAEAGSGRGGGGESEQNAAV